MPSRTIENYLKALYYLHLKNEDISLTDLGEELGVSKPTANDMIKKLEGRQWVIYEKYKPIRLSPLGKGVAAGIIRKHRLSEMFLAQIMHFGWEEVHEVAEELEHIKTEKFFDRMDELLGFPTTDPHGSPIPDKDGNFVSQAYERLSQIPPGQRVKVQALRDSSTDFLLYLNKKDIGLGTMLLVVSIENFDKSLVVEMAGRQETLSEAVAGRLLVSRLR